jgi:hypothetical protein
LDHFPIIEIPNKITNHVYYTLINPEKITMGYIDLTRWFSKKSSWRNEYIMVAYHFDTNYIRALLIKKQKRSYNNRSMGETSQWFQESGSYSKNLCNRQWEVQRSDR